MTLQNKLGTINNNVPVVHQAGKDEQARVLWEYYQRGGERTDYLSAFAGMQWDAENFKPLYDMQPTYADMMFFWFNHPLLPYPEDEEGNYILPEPLDLVDRLASVGKTLDFSKCTNFWRAFSYAYVSHVGTIDFKNCRYIGTFTDENGNSIDDEREVTPTKWSAMFKGSYITTIDKLIFYSYNPSFDAKWLPETLVNVTCEGEIFHSGLDLSVCKDITHDSIMQFINVLTDLNNEGYNQTIIAEMKAENKFVVTLGADHLAKLTDEEKAVATNKGWTLL